MGKKRKLNRHLKEFLLSAVFLSISGLMVWSGIQDIRTMFSLRTAIADSEEESANLDQQQSDLETARENLDNPDYIEYIARGKYLVTKSGEQIFKFPSLNTEE